MSNSIFVTSTNYSAEVTSFELHAPDEIEWARPNGLPSGFETLNVYTCAREGAASSPMEIATTRYTQAGETTLASLKRIHTLRQNQRVTPVLITTMLSDCRVSLSEPTTSTSPTRSIYLSKPSHCASMTCGWFVGWRSLKIIRRIAQSRLGRK